MDMSRYFKGQHADEMHGPDPATQCHGTRGNSDLPIPAALGMAGNLSGLQRHGGGENTDKQRQQHQPRVVCTV